MNIVGISGLHHSVGFKKAIFPELSKREYRIAQGYDAAAALVTRDGIEAAAAEERFVREKATGAFPVHAIRYCLEAGGIQIDDVDYLAHGFAYEPVKEYFDQTEYTSSQYEKVFAPDVQIKLLNAHFPSVDWARKFVSVPHHLAHAASTFYPSGFEEALILVSDGMGEIHSMSVLVGDHQGLRLIEQVPALHSLGVLYGVFTLFLGFYMGLDEYKIMGLAPYGDRRRYFNAVMEFIRLKPDGTYSVPILAKNKTIEEKETHRGVLDALEESFGPKRKPEAEITQREKDLAAALQAALEACQLHVLRHFRHKTGQKNLCMAGGVALNCTANGVIKRSRLFKNMFIQPAAGDDGCALGAALYVQKRYDPTAARKKMTVPLWGPGYSEQEINSEIGNWPLCESTHFESFEELAEVVAQRIADGHIVAWFQGRMEYGPRALGNRSILADPSAPDMRDRVNELIKKREGFRPFAPAVATEHASEYFQVNQEDSETYAHMLYVTQIRSNYAEQLPAITHVNGSARIQTVSRDHNARFWTLLDKFRKITGMPVLLNTSFNVRGQPIVCTPKEAIETFLYANLDLLVIGNYLLATKAKSADGPRAWENKIEESLIK